jgi:hypothetical protein
VAVLLNVSLDHKSMEELRARSGTDAVRIGLLAGLDGADEELQPLAA